MVRFFLCSVYIKDSIFIGVSSRAIREMNILADVGEQVEKRL